MYHYKKHHSSQVDLQKSYHPSWGIKHLAPSSLFPLQSLSCDSRLQVAEESLLSNLSPAEPAEPFLRVVMPQLICRLTSKLFPSFFDVENECFHLHRSHSKRMVEAHPFRSKLSSINKRLKSPHSPRSSRNKTHYSTSTSQNLNPVIEELISSVSDLTNLSSGLASWAVDWGFRYKAEDSFASLCSCEKPSAGPLEVLSTATNSLAICKDISIKFSLLGSLTHWKMSAFYWSNLAYSSI